MPGVIHPEIDPTTNQQETASLTASPSMQTGPLPPNATTVAGTAEDGDEGNDPKGRPQTAQAAIDRIKKAEYATSEDRENAMKKWPHLFAETAEN